MTARISDERPDIDLQSLCDRLREVFNADDDTPDELCTEAREAIEELWQERDASRALVTELRALAERLAKGLSFPDPDLPEFEKGENVATVSCLSELDSLLAAHDAQQAEGKP